MANKTSPSPSDLPETLTQYAFGGKEPDTLSIKKLAEELDLHQSTVYGWMRGKGQPGLEVALKLSETYGAPMTKLRVPVRVQRKSYSRPKKRMPVNSFSKLDLGNATFESIGHGKVRAEMYLDISDMGDVFVLMKIAAKYT